MVRAPQPMPLAALAAKAGAKAFQRYGFTEQTLRPHERVRMPVVFYVDPGFAKDPDAGQIDEITLSYTFYPVAKPKTAS